MALTALTVLIASMSISQATACGHHGHVASSTERFASYHLKHKQRLRDVAKAHNLVLGAAATEQQQRHLRRSMQEAEGTSALLLQQILYMQQLQSSTIQSGANSTQGSPTGTSNDTALLPAPIRLHIEYQDDTTGSTHSMLVNITKTVVQILQTYLSVRSPVQGAFLASHMCIQGDGLACQAFYPVPNSPNSTLSTCGMARINPSHILDPSTCNESFCKSYAGGVGSAQTDMYMYITSVQDDHCNRGAAAWARPCLYDMITNRPVLGSANVCPFSLTSTDPDTLVSIMVHEMIHALGFTSGLFPAFINPATNIELPMSAIATTANINGKQVTRVVSPTVQREARAQFGCDALEGAQMEDEGGAGSANAHWEYSHYQGELMLATATFSVAGEPARLSRLTLALLEDSGWYVGNWTHVGGPLQWARNTGCTLPQQGCQAFLDSDPAASEQNLFCDATAATASQRYLVSASYRSAGLCQVSSFANGCGMVRARGGMPSCESPTYQYPNPESFGWYNLPTSRAYPVIYKFAVTLDSGGYIYFPAVGNDGDRDAACFPSTCQGGQLFLNINGQNIRCPSGQYVALAAQLPGSYRTGTVGPCPNENLVCRTLDCPPCNVQGGVCYDGKCICKLGWTGADCSFSLLQNTTAPPNPSLTSLGSQNLPPSPPAVINVTQWYQQVSVSFQLSNITLTGLQTRTQALLSAFAGWANMSASTTQLSNATQTAVDRAAGKRRQLQAAAAAIVASDSLHAELPPLTAVVVHEDSAPAVSAPVPEQGPLPVSRRLLPQDCSSTGSGGQTGNRLMAVGSELAHRLGRLVGRAAAGLQRHGVLRRSVLDLPSIPQGVVVTILVRPGSTQQTSQLMGRLANQTQQIQLEAKLQQAGFLMIPGTLQSVLTIRSEVVSVPANSPFADGTANKAMAESGSVSTDSKVLSWTVIIIAVSVGAGVMCLGALVLIVAYVRSVKANSAATQLTDPYAAGVEPTEPQPAGSPRSRAWPLHSDSSLHPGPAGPAAEAVEEWSVDASISQERPPATMEIRSAIGVVSLFNPLFSSPTRRRGGSTS